MLPMAFFAGQLGICIFDAANDFIVCLAILAGVFIDWHRLQIPLSHDRTGIILSYSNVEVKSITPVIQQTMESRKTTDLVCHSQIGCSIH